MLIWFKRFALFGGIVIVLELVAWVGIATLGPDAFRRLIAFYDPRREQAEVVEQRGDDGSLQRCALYRGELLCIGENDSPAEAAASEAPPPEPALASAALDRAEETGAMAEQRCATYEGQTICIKEGT